MPLAGAATADRALVHETAAALGLLVFRIRGTSRDGQLVSIRARKCTIGSGPDCTLRLLAFGVRPLHCLIVRGSRASVVRRWSPDTLLNGRSFSDAELRAGDRLQIGPIELEVVQTTGAMPLAQAPRLQKSQENPDFSQLASRLELANRQGRRRVRRAVAALREARKEIARLEGTRSSAVAAAAGLDTARKAIEADQQRLASQQKALEAERAGWLAEKQAALAKVAEATAQANLERTELDTQKAAFQAERRRWADQRQAEETALRQERRALEDREARIAKESQRLSQQVLDHDRQARALAAERAGFAQERTEWESQKDSQTADSTASAAAIEVAAKQIEAQRRELEAAARQIEAQRRELEESRSRWTRQREEEDRQHAQRLADLDAREARLEAERQQQSGRARDGAAEARRLETQQKSLQTARDAIQVERESLRAEQRTLQTQRQALETEQKSLEAERESLRTQQESLETERRQLQAEQENLESQKEALRSEREAWQAERQAEEERLRRLEAELDEARQMQGESGPPEEAQVAEPAHRGSGSGAACPVDVNEVLGRLGVALLPEEEEYDAMPPSDGAEKTARRSSRPLEVRRPASEEDEGDESIDAYMAQLMQRVRATSIDTAARPSAAEEARKPAKPAQETPAEAPAASPAPTEAPVEAARRRPVPEDPHRLIAMRELATGAAHTAIDEHSQKMLRYAAYNKLMIMVSAGLCGIGLIAGWALWGLSTTSYYSGLVCILLSLVWGVQYAVLTGRLIGHRSRANARRRDEEASDAASSGSEPGAGPPEETPAES